MSETREQQARELVQPLRVEAKLLIGKSEKHANNGEYHRADICLARGNELDGAASRLEITVARALAACALEEARLAQQEFHEHFYLGSNDPDGLMECLDARVMALERAAGEGK